MHKHAFNKPLPHYDPENKRLVYIGREATPDMWHNRWQITDENIQTKLAVHSDSRVPRITARYLRPQDGIILEGGCGFGGKVKSLSQAGYRVVGVDFDAQTVSCLNRNAPELDIRLGDVRQLPIADASVAGYWSLGVIEHFYDGFDEIAREMSRVIKPGGYLFLSHPYMSPLRRIKARLGRYPIYNGREKPENFYQFALNHRAVIQALAPFGFKCCLFKWGPGLPGFNKEIFSPLAVAISGYNGKSRLIKGARYILNKTFAPFTSHGCLMVFRLSQNTTQRPGGKK